MKTKQHPLERFLNKIDNCNAEQCWLWKGCKDRGGYGWFKILGKQLYAHRWIYEQTIGPIPMGLVIDHLCRVHNCVNPDHLEPVTPAENTRRGEAGRVCFERNKAKTSCPQGHPYAGDNLYVGPDKGRDCKICRRAADKRRYYRAKERRTI